MPRSRYIKHGFFTNYDLDQCSDAAQRIFIGLWTIADRDGRLRDHVSVIKANLSPYQDRDISALLDELAQPREDTPDGFITRYVVEGVGYIQVNNFALHQYPHKNEPSKCYPPPPEGIASRSVPYSASTELAPSESVLAPNESVHAPIESEQIAVITDNCILKSEYLVPDYRAEPESDPPPPVSDEPPGTDNPFDGLIDWADEAVLVTDVLDLPHPTKNQVASIVKAYLSPENRDWDLHAIALWYRDYVDARPPRKSRSTGENVVPRHLAGWLNQIGLAQKWGRGEFRRSFAVPEMESGSAPQEFLDRVAQWDRLATESAQRRPARRRTMKIVPPLEMRDAV